MYDPTLKLVQAVRNPNPPIVAPAATPVVDEKQQEPTSHDDA